MIDAYRLGVALSALIEARRNGVEVDALALELFTRKLIEQAIVVSYAAEDPQGAERILQNS